MLTKRVVLLDNAPCPRGRIFSDNISKFGQLAFLFASDDQRKNGPIQQKTLNNQPNPFGIVTFWSYGK